MQHKKSLLFMQKRDLHVNYDIACSIFTYFHALNQSISKLFTREKLNYLFTIKMHLWVLTAFLTRQKILITTLSCFQMRENTQINFLILIFILIQGFKLALVQGPGPSISDARPLKFHLPRTWTYRTFKFVVLKKRLSHQIQSSNS